MTRARPFFQVDVFAREPYRGNPVAVIADAEGLGDDDMRRIAHWTNLSETTFLLAPDDPAADYRVRIFTPAAELPFAGHPTLGTARAWLAGGGLPRTPGTIVQECGVGLVTLRDDGETLAFAAPETIRTGPLGDDDLARIAAALGIPLESVLDHQWVDNGPGWAAVRLASADEVLALEPDLSLIPDLKVGAIGAHPDGHAAAFEIRAFAPALGVGEDPVTGSLNASVAQWMTRTRQAPDRYVVAQGTRLGRSGQVSISVDGDDVWVGGPARVLFSGTALA